MHLVGFTVNKFVTTQHGHMNVKKVINLVTNEAVSRRRLNIETRLQSNAIPGEVYGRQSGTLTGSSVSTSVLPCQKPSRLMYWIVRDRSVSQSAM